MKTLTQIVALTVLAVCAGCASSVDVKVAPNALIPREIAVFDFEDQDVYKAAREYTLWSIVGSGRPGALLARSMRRAMDKSDKFDVVAYRDMRTKLASARVDQDAGDQNWLDMGETLGSNAVVVGRIFEYRTFSILFVQWTKVEFSARCLAVDSGEELWRASAKGRAFYTIEEDLAARLSREIVDQLR